MLENATGVNVLEELNTQFNLGTVSWLITKKENGYHLIITIADETVFNSGVDDLSDVRIAILRALRHHI